MPMRFYLRLADNAIMKNIKQFLRFIIVAPVNLSIKGKIFSLLACFSSVFLVAWVTKAFILGTAYPIAVASIGASAVTLFIIPNSPLAQPWSLVGGQMLSAIVGVWCSQTFIDKPLAAACAVMLSALVMLLFRCLHPPGAATALTPVVAGNSLGYDFVLTPVALNIAIMLVLAILINRWILRYDYPTFFHQADDKKNKMTQPAQHTGVSTQDMEHALENMDMFMDISAGDLNKLLTEAQIQSFKRNKGNVTCADIMVTNIQAVEYGTEVEDAWKIMHNEKLKAMPVIDRAKRVIGIITWNDFFKYINVNAHETFQEKLWAFIRRTPDTSTNKPEAVGHIMTRAVAVLSENTHIAALIPLMLDQGYRQIPIVNNENRLVGMVYQANLIAALYHKNQLL